MGGAGNQEWVCRLIRNEWAGNQEWAGTVSICIHNEETFDKKAQALILHQLVIFLITNMQ